MAFEITMIQAGPVADVTLSGDLDASAFDRFREEMESLEETAAGRLTHLVLRMAGLSFLASAGIRRCSCRSSGWAPGLTIYVIAPEEQALDSIRRARLRSLGRDPRRLSSDDGMSPACRELSRGAIIECRRAAGCAEPYTMQTKTLTVPPTLDSSKQRLRSGPDQAAQSSGVSDERPV